MFGNALDGSPYFYRFVLTAGGFWAIQRRDGNSPWTALNSGTATGYLPYPATNRLKVVRAGSSITGYVNGVLAGTANDGTYTGSLRVGLSAGATYAGADVRFDNYGVYSAACAGQVTALASAH